MKLLILLLLAACFSNALGRQYVEYVDDGSGIYFDPIGKAKILSRPLEVVAVSNISFVQTRTEYLVKSLANANRLCSVVMMFNGDDYCQKNVELLSKSLSECDKQFQNLINSLTRGRVKRETDWVEAANAGIEIASSGLDLINKAKDVFKRPASSDSTKYDEYAKILSQNQNALEQKFKTKIFALNSSLGVINDDIFKITKNEERIQESLKNISNTINNEIGLSLEDRKFIMQHGDQIAELTIETKMHQNILKVYRGILNRNNETLKHLENQIDNLKIKDDMLSLLLILQNEISTFKIKLDDIVNSVVIAKWNILNTAVITHQMMYEELSKNVYKISSDDELLHPLTLRNMQSILDDSKINTYLINTSLIFIISLPLVSKTEYVIYNGVPFPMMHDPETFVYIEPRKSKLSHLLLSKNKASYTHVDLNKNCRKPKDVYLCTADSVYAVGSVPSCDVKLLTEHLSSLPQECEMKILNGHVNIWNQLLGNRWLFIQSEKNRLSIDCKGEALNEILIQGSGILSMPLNCTAKTKYVHLAYSGETNTMPAPNTFFTLKKDECCTPERLESLKTQRYPSKTKSVDAAILKNYAYDFHKSETVRSSDDNTLSIIMYTSLTVLITVTIFFIVKFILCISKNYRHILSVVGISSSFDVELVQMTPPNGPGIYFDPIGKMKFSAGHLEVVTSVDVQNIQTNMMQLLNTLKSAAFQCEQIKVLSSRTTCENTLNSHAEMWMENLSRFGTNSEIANAKRKKRGVLAVMGAISLGLSLVPKIFKLFSPSKPSFDYAKYDNLFKTMDSNLRTFEMSADNKLVAILTHVNSVEANLKTIHEIENRIQSDLNGVFEMLDKSMRLSQENRNFIKKNSDNIKMLNMTLEESQEVIEEFANILEQHKEFIQRHNQSIIVLNLENDMSNLLFNIQTEMAEIIRRLNNVMDGYTISKKGVIHPNIISPQQLLKALNLKLETDDLELPTHPILENMKIITELSDIDSYPSDDKYLVFIIKVPLVHKMEYNIFRAVPLPIPIGGNGDAFVFIESSDCEEYFALSADRLTYTKLASFDKCKTITAHNMMCPPENIIPSKAVPICETELLLDAVKELPKECEVRFLHGSIDYWHRLQNNKWIFVQSHPKRLTLDCNDKQTFDDVIVGSGILNIPMNCSAYFGINKLVNDVRDVIDIDSPKVFFDLSADDCCRDDNLVKWKDLVTPAKMTSNDVDHFVRSSYRLSEDWSDGSSKPRIEIYVLASAAFIIVVCLFVYQCWKTKKSDRVASDEIVPTSLSIFKK